MSWKLNFIMAINKEQLNFAGWLSIISALIAIIVFIMTFQSVKESKDIKILLTLISLGIFIYIFLSLRRLLNGRFKFHDVDMYISVLIWGNVILSFSDMAFLIYGETDMIPSVILVVAFVLLQIVYIIFALKILRLSDNLFGLLKPFSYTSIAGGICLASIVLIPLGLIVSAAADVILGMIFFRAAQQKSYYGG